MRVVVSGLKIRWPVAGQLRPCVNKQKQEARLRRCVSSARRHVDGAALLLSGRNIAAWGSCAMRCGILVRRDGERNAA